MVSHIINEEQNSMTLKAFVFETYPTMKMSVFANALKSGDIKINKKRVRDNVPLNTGDSLDIYIADELLFAIDELDIAFEDHNIIVVNKSTQISCIDEKGGYSLCTVVAQYMSEQGEYDEVLGHVPYLCHRLDTKTGGLVIFAKNEPAYDCITSSFKTRLINKYYFTAVVGEIEPKSARLSAHLYKDAKKSEVKIYDSSKKNTQSILTEYTAAKTIEGISILEVRLVTGRTHQIRAHLAHIGYPVLGDDKYGDRRANKHYNVNYQVLWAKKITLAFAPTDVLYYLNGKCIETNNMVLPAIIRNML